MKNWINSKRSKWTCWRFEQDEKWLISDVVDWGKEWIFTSIIVWILSHSEFVKDPQGELMELSKKFWVLKEDNKTPLYAYDVWKCIDSTSSSIWKILSQTKIYTRKWLQDIIAMFKYQLYIYWVLQLLKYRENYDDTDKINKNKFKKNLEDVDDTFAREIYNIFQDESLTSLFIVLKSQGILDFTKNPVNKFTKERELKILDVNKDSLENKLSEMWATKLYDWKEVDVIDTYYDYPWLWLDKKWKRSLRIREVKYPDWKEEVFYTIKRKSEDTSENSRVCLEREFKVKKSDAFKHTLLDFGLVESKKKTKKRTSYSLKRDWKVFKFDIDDYPEREIPPLLEIEAEDNKDIRALQKELWLSKNETSNKGSRWVYELYGVIEKYMKNYQTKKTKKWWTKITWLGTWDVYYLGKDRRLRSKRIQKIAS